MSESELVTAAEASKILNVTRANIERLQLTKKLIPQPTIHCRYYFLRSDVTALKESRDAKKLKKSA